jgi:type II secretory pathway pseudopilin PulG
MHCRKGSIFSGMDKRKAGGFSLIEILVASGVVCIAIISVIAIVRKGQEQMVVEKHRRAARAIVDTILEAPKYSPGKYNSITDGTILGSFSLDNNFEAKDTIRISSDTISGVPYKIIRAKLQWVEPNGGAVDSVAMERWVPNIPSPINIAPFVSFITGSSRFVQKNLIGCVSPEVYFCYPGCAVDGVAGARITGDWAIAGHDDNPSWIRLRWAQTHRVYKIVLYNRVNLDPGYEAYTAYVTFRNGGGDVNTLTLSIPHKGSATAVFRPIVINELFVHIDGSTDWMGLSEIEVYE